MPDQDVVEKIPETVLLARYFGIAMVPFVVSVIYGCTSCGSRRIPWSGDMLALILGIGAYFLGQKIVEPILWDAIPLEPHWPTLFSTLAGLLCMSIAFPLIYKILYLRQPLELEEGPAH